MSDNNSLQSFCLSQQPEPSWWLSDLRVETHIISSTHLLCCPSEVIRSRIYSQTSAASGQVNHRSYIKYRLTGSQSQTVEVNLCYFKTHRLTHAKTVTVVVNHRHTPLTSTRVQRWEKEKEWEKETVWPEARNIEPIIWQLSALVASVELWTIFMGALPLYGETWIYSGVASVPSCLLWLPPVWLAVPPSVPVRHTCTTAGRRKSGLIWREMLGSSSFVLNTNGAECFKKRLNEFVQYAIVPFQAILF